MTFEKFPKSLLQDERRLFEIVAERIQKQVESPQCEPMAERLAIIPAAGRTVYWLWLFNCEAGCGMDVFILNSLGIYAPEIHAALKAAGAGKLTRQIEEAIPAARRGPAEFKRLKDQTWFEQFEGTGEDLSWNSINKKAFASLEELPRLAISFIKANAKALFAD
jgi:hypothetical protein